MGKIKRGNYIFISWIGDHGHHVHVYKNRKLVVKWDLDENKIIKGKINSRLLKIIKTLQNEGQI